MVAQEPAGEHGARPRARAWQAGAPAGQQPLACDVVQEAPGRHSSTRGNQLKRQSQLAKGSGPLPVRSSRKPWSGCTTTSSRTGIFTLQGWGGRKGRWKGGEPTEVAERWASAPACKAWLPADLPVVLGSLPGCLPACLCLSCLLPTLPRRPTCGCVARGSCAPAQSPAACAPRSSGSAHRPPAQSNGDRSVFRVGKAGSTAPPAGCRVGAGQVPAQPVGVRYGSPGAWQPLYKQLAIK